MSNHHVVGALEGGRKGVTPAGSALPGTRRRWVWEGKAPWPEGTAQAKAERCEEAEVHEHYVVWGVSGVETGGMARAQTNH